VSRSYSVPSQEEIEENSGGDRVALPGNEQYLAEVVELEDITKPNFDGKMQDYLKCKWNITSFRDGSDLEDLDQTLVPDGRWIWRDIDFARVGFMRDGTPSLARQFFLSAIGQSDMTAKIEDISNDDIMGKQMVLTLVVYNKQKDGKQANRVSAISPVRAPRRGGATVDAASSEALATQPANTTATELPPEMAAAVADLTADLGGTEENGS